MRLLPRMNVMFNFIFMGLLDLPEASRKRQNTKWKSLATVGLEPTTLRCVAWCYTDWASRAFMIAVLLKWPYTLMYLRYQCIHWYKFENDKLERFLSYTCTVLCYIYLNWQNIKETHKSCDAFNVQTRPNTSRSGKVFGRVLNLISLWILFSVLCSPSSNRHIEVSWP